MNTMVDKRDPHVTIARHAVKQGWCSFEAVSRFLIRLGQLPQGTESSSETWVDEGILTRAQVRDALAALGQEAQPEAQDSDATQTWMSLPTGVPRASAEVSFAQRTTGSFLGVQRSEAGFERVESAQTGQHEPPGTTLGQLAAVVSSRYVLGEVLGQGGGGRVVRAYDQLLDRHVAMKILHVSKNRKVETLERFIKEAQITSQLEHPNIMPIYNFGTLENGDLYYTMREIDNISLRQVFDHLRQGDARIESDYSIWRLVSILAMICQALDYAHDHQVIHRDLKPDNIMLGQYGEVLVMDWGLSLSLNDRDNSFERALRKNGSTLGTPSYMPPEQARGELDLIDARSDVYGLGAILYEILTLTPPYEGVSAIEVMWSVVEGELPLPSERTSREIPMELERICMRAMAPRRELRYPNVKAMHEALNHWIEGVQSIEALKRVRDALAWAQRYAILRRELSSLQARAALLEHQIEPWAKVEAKKALWDVQDRCQIAHLESARAFGLAVSHFNQALANQPEMPEALEGLADLYWHKFEEAEAHRDTANVIYFKTLVAQYDIQHKYNDLLKEVATIQLDSAPPGSSVWICSFAEGQRQLVATKNKFLGQTPVAHELKAQSYLVELEHPDRPMVRYPVLLRRGESLVATVELPRASVYKTGFKFVPAGAFVSGGDPMAFGHQAQTISTLDSFFISEYPVTFRDYLIWINELQALDPAQAQLHAPQVRTTDGMLARLDEQKGTWIPDEILIEGASRELYPIGAGHEWNIPVVGIRHEDALAYIQWRSERDGISYRLPRALEHEKASRGVDGRLFPWGNHFDATFCKMRHSRPYASQLEPIGVFEADVSPYGVRDLAGGVQEWCMDEQEVPGEQAEVRGGSWNVDDRLVRSASRIKILRFVRTSFLGFRLTYDNP